MDIAWKWSRSTLYRFMLRHGFIQDDQVAHFEYTKSRKEIDSMRDVYLEWISDTDLRVLIFLLR